MKAKLQVNFGLGQGGPPTVRLYIQELEYDECKRKVQRCLSPNRLSFSELFDDMSLMLNVRRLCAGVDCLISAAKVCDCVISS